MKRVWAIRPVAAAILLGAVLCSPLAVPSWAQTAESATQTLLDKAHALEVRGRLDMAAQTWQQVLLTDPRNVEALAGLARAAKLSGNEPLASTYLDRLRAINPNDPNIARVERLGSEQSQAAELQQAGKYAKAGQYAQAMGIYRKVFGNNPPPGDWALAYYETEAATEDGRPHAIAGLRSLVEKYPNDSRYQIALGRILTYSPQTRAEGRRYLERHPNDPQAVEALRQSLVWDASNPASAADIRAYLAKHNDAQLAQALKNQPKPAPGKPAMTPEEIAAGQAARARSEQEQAAYAALNAKRLDDAEARFKAILAKDPENPQALAGMGYVRMQQSNFGGAMSFLEQAKQYGARDAGLDKALETAHFYSVMGDGSIALNENDLPAAEQKYREALELRPGSYEALEGLGGTLLKAQHPESAVPIFEQYVKSKPSAAAAWRGLFMAQYGAGDASGALQTEHRIPPAVRSQLMKDPDFLRTLASAYSAVGRDADAQRVLRSALELPFPTGARGLQVETQLQYAALLQQANRLDQAAALYRQALATDPANAQAWQGIVRIEHALKHDDQAAQALTTMPPSVYQVAMRDPGFQTTVASIYQSLNKLDIAQDILEKSVQQQVAAGQKPSSAIMLQLAGIYLTRNNAQQAFPIYRQILTENPDRPDAWKGLLAILHGTGRDQEALAQIQQIPTPVRTLLESDVEYLQTVGAIYNALGQPQQAMLFVNRVQQHYAMQHAAPPADIDIQDAWLLFNGGNDAGLYRQLMLLGGRQDLSDEQRRTVQMIWSNWAVRRANQSAAAGNLKRSLAILNAAAKAFPDNPGVLRALASGYARAGLPKQAVLIFEAQDMTSASASDYKAAVGAALAAGDIKTAETWLRYGLDQYPKDSEMLTLGAKFEQARGDSNRAADYFRASLAAMPPGDPGAELASELSQPAPVGRLPSATQSQDLASLLGTPDGTGAGSQNAPAPPPYLPSYTNAYGQAPVQVPPGDSGHSSVVPSYMSNPASRRSKPGSTSRLGDYAPQSAAAAPTPISTLPPTATTATIAPIEVSAAPATSSEYQRQQILRLTEQAEARPPITAVPQQDVYGPYVPYVPPTQNTGYTPSPVAVQLGDNTPHQEPPQREVTDVLPTARYVPNARPGSRSASRPMTGVSTPPPDDNNSPSTQNAQYTAQAQPQQPGESYGQQYPQPGVVPYGSGTAARRRRAPSQTASAPPAKSQPPLNYPNVPHPLSDSGYPVIGPPAPQGTPPTDADLVAKSIPPLRGGYDANAVVPGGPLSPRARNELELAALEGSYSGWIGGTGFARYRSGTVGFDRLTDIEAPFEASAVLGKTLRATVIPRPVFLNSGAIDTTAFQNQTSGVIPVLGTLPANALTQPQQQFSTGVGGEFQLTTVNIGLAVGYTPYGFLVSNVTGRLRWRPAGGHFTFYGDRDSVKDTQLSYAGLRDPGSITPIFQGNIWGGVIATGGGVRLDMGNEKSGLYVFGDGAVLTGFHVLENRKYEGQMGAYFRVKTWPGYGSLNIGTSFFGMHFDHNERGMTYGQGGYFSPNVYFLAGVPVTYNGYYKTDFHYSINGSVGVQTFQEASAPFYPLDRPLQTGSGNAMFPQNSDTSVNYALNAEGSYRFADHWYVGAFVEANNTNNYNMISGGFFVRYLFKPQYPTETYPTGLFPTSGSTFRPIRVP
jgi:cellulose synthase operon protein C